MALIPNIVVGSGPAGVSCAKGLMAAGQKVLMLDTGTELEADKAALVREMSAKKPTEWSPELLQSYKKGQVASTSGVTQKKVYGSDYPYRGILSEQEIASQSCVIYRSQALGGLSQVWGSAILPYTSLDTKDWPFPIEELQSHYQSVLSFMPHASQPDDIDQLFSWKYPHRTPLSQSAQAQHLLKNLESNRTALKMAGIHFGGSRLATQATQGKEPGCVACGLCLYGCPYGCIYTSASTVALLKKNSQFQYQKGVVSSFVETSNGVELTIKNGTSSLKLQAGKVFLACGPLETARLMLKRPLLKNKKLVMKDSQYFLMPLWSQFATSNVDTESLHTLAQIFLEIKDASVSPKGVHLQLYTYNDLIKSAVQGKMGILSKLLPVKQLLSRLLVIQGFLHSDLSSQIELTWDGKKMSAVGKINPEVKLRVLKISSKLSAMKKELGFQPLKPLLNIGLPGQGWHTGATFPMKKNPTQWNESDLQGRPFDLKRIHVVDASVLPSIPATTITLSIMANAHRIGSFAGK